MLVVSLKTLQNLHIGPDVTVKIIKGHRGCYRIGIEAPTELHIWRGPVNHEPHEPPPAAPAQAERRAA